MTVTLHLARVALVLASVLPLCALAQAGKQLQGEVLEVQQVDAYTYLLLKTPGGPAWAAVPTAKVAKGERVTIANAAPMDNFESRTLKRRFERIYFGTLGGGAAAAPAAGTGRPLHAGSPMAGAMGSPMGGSPSAAAHAQAGAAKAAAPAALPTAPVAKASGANARTVAEVVQGKAALKDQTVVVQARVVKVNNGIMGKNWLHLQDGSGLARDGTHDLLVTTQDSAVAGDIVTARGVVRTNVAVGAGYEYAVMLEGASLRK